MRKDCIKCHYRNFQFYLEMGLELVEIHQVMEFHQEAILEPYIIGNSEERKYAVSIFEKTLWKLLNNVIYGKSMENVRNCKNVKLVTVQQRGVQIYLQRLYRFFQKLGYGTSSQNSF